MRELTICWFSCGAASAVAAKMTLSANPEAMPVYLETGSEHADNERFLADCERWFGKAIMRRRSATFADTWAVWEKRRYLSGINGAPCTGELKFVPRMDWIEANRPSTVHVWGYTADASDRKRAQRMVEAYPNMIQRNPLIDAGLTKANVLAIIQGAGIELPAMYALGFQNNNCIPCVKATSPAYWALIRQHFPTEFERMAKLSRELGARLTILSRERDENGKVRNIRGFIDEIPLDQATKDPIAPACDFLCQFAAQDMEAA